MENKLTAEVLKKLKPAKNAEELTIIAKENGVELSGEAAKAFFEKLNELTDEELADVAAGCGGGYFLRCKNCGIDQFIWPSMTGEIICPLCDYKMR